MKKRVTLIMLLMVLLLAGCASTSSTRASGDSSAAIHTGDITTTTTTAPDGTVTVEEICLNCVIDESVGGKGSTEFYGTIAEIFMGFIGIASLLFQVL